jgi:hypothetical protein
MIHRCARFLCMQKTYFQEGALRDQTLERHCQPSSLLETQFFEFGYLANRFGIALCSRFAVPLGRFG